jgi:hypothetical protein
MAKGRSSIRPSASPRSTHRGRGHTGAGGQGRGLAFCLSCPKNDPADARVVEAEVLTDLLQGIAAAGIGSRNCCIAVPKDAGSERCWVFPFAFGRQRSPHNEGVCLASEIGDWKRRFTTGENAALSRHRQRCRVSTGASWRNFRFSTGTELPFTSLLSAWGRFQSALIPKRLHQSRAA